MFDVSSLLWFHEIEAGFAYLLQDVVDRLWIDRRLVMEPYDCGKKYQKLIEQLHPRLDMSLADFNVNTLTDVMPKDFRYFPKLEVLFKNGELTSVYQPIIEYDGNNYIIHGIECLSRILYNGQYYAPEFIFNYAAEKLRLTHYDKICLTQTLISVPHDQNTIIFINVRPQTLIGPDFVHWFKSILKQRNLVPSQIVIEVTEQYCNISEQEMSIQCRNLKQQGFRLAIDDFGSGISNLSMLEIMDPSYLKISGRFIKNAGQNLKRQKIIKNVLDLAKELGIIAIVESIEEGQEWAQVQKLGANLAQGFYFYKPMAKADVELLLKKPLPIFE